MNVRKNKLLKMKHHTVLYCQKMFLLYRLHALLYMHICKKLYLNKELAIDSRLSIVKVRY